MRFNFFVVVLVAFATGAFGAVDTEQAAHDVLRRLIGDKRAKEFVFSIDLSLRQPSRGPKHVDWADAYTVSARNGTVFVAGSSGVALTSGAYWYLKNVTRCIVTWGVNGTGDQLSLPQVLPDIASTRVVTIVPLRYAWNMCTFDYSAPWWDEARWLREIDWMALHGINLPLALIGQEHVWMIVFSKLGVDLKELEEWFSGPAFLAWQRAGNIRKFAGPLTQAFIDYQRNLQRFILTHMRALGMMPVLPCFSGHVPKVFRQVFPNATLTQSPSWNNFPPDMTDVYMVDPTQPVFETIGKLFMETVIEEFGESHFYSCDTFNEVDPTSTSPSYLAAASRAVVKSIQEADPAGVWVMQGWLFHFDFWTYDRVRAYLSGVADDSMLILDLNSEIGALAPKFSQYFGKHWVWNMLHNYGGVRGVYGNLTRIATGPLEDLFAPNSTMVGIGFTPEAIEQNPVMYEMLTSTFYATQPIDVIPWLKDYVTQRYGTSNDLAWKTWEFLFQSVYDQPGEPRTELEHMPTWEQPDFGWQYGSPPLMMEAALTMILAADTLPDVESNGPFQYDLVDVVRQATTMFFTDVHRVIVNQLTAVLWNGATLNKTAFNQSSALLLEIIEDLDELLGTNPNYQLGRWTTQATDRAASEEEANRLMYNARNQITLWGPDGQISNYAAKAWHHLYGDYYYVCWKMMIDSILTQGVETWNKWVFQSDLLTWEQSWCDNTTAYSPEPSGKSAVAVAKKIMSKINGDVSKYVALANFSGGRPLGQYTPMWTNRTEQLAKLCEIAPGCDGFDSHGVLRTGISGLSPTTGSTIYVKESWYSVHGK